MPGLPDWRRGEALHLSNAGSQEHNAGGWQAWRLQLVERAFKRAPEVSRA